MALWDSVAGLTVKVDGYSLQRRESSTPGGWTRVTTTVVIQGDGATGEGEDVTYSADDHEHVPEGLMLAGTWSLEDLSHRLDELELWSGDPDDHTGQDHRRWGFESAILDLALRQNELGLGEAVGREERPVRFVVSTRAAPEGWLEVAPRLEFKLDAE
jgi:hypothetical protein